MCCLRHDASQIIGEQKNKLDELNRRQHDYYVAAKPKADVNQILIDRSSVVDQIIADLWLQLKFSKDLCIVAVGGYGRGELFPHSDIDLLIISETLTDQQSIRSFIQILWDLKLKVGSSVRGLQDCFDIYDDDVTVQTNYLENRFLCGSWELFQKFHHLLKLNTKCSLKFFQAKEAEQKSRYETHRYTFYSLEPNIKTNPGGLRDVQTIMWLGRHCLGINSWFELVDNNIITKEDLKKLLKAVNLIGNIRFALHHIGSKDDNRLLFEHQRLLSKHFGFEDKDGKLAVEQFMRQYYRATAEIQRINSLAMQSIFELLLPRGQAKTPAQTINSRFQIRRGLLEIRSNDTFKRYPIALVEIFYLMQRDHKLRNPSGNTLRALGDHLYLVDHHFRQDIRVQSLFMEIFKHEDGIGWVLNAMHRYGFLAAYIPSYKRVTGLMQFDLFHVYTVDAHSLQVVSILRTFFRQEETNCYPHAKEVAKQIDRPYLLYLAGFLHDLGKGLNSEHEIMGAKQAKQFCILHRLNESEIRLVTWLVRHHLMMSMVAQKKDLQNPQVIADFCQSIPDPKYIDYLYLLTIADISGTAPALLNDYRKALLRLLWDKGKTSCYKVKPIRQKILGF